MKRAAVVLFVLLGLIAGSVAAQSQALPPLDVVAADGVPASVVRQPDPSSWLILYVSPECPPCDRLIQMLPTWQPAPSAGRVVVIVGAPLADARAYVDGINWLPASGVSWFADPAGAAAKSLKLTGRFGLSGVRADRLEWTVAGVLNDPSSLKSVVESWLRR